MKMPLSVASEQLCYQFVQHFRNIQINYINLKLF